MVSLSSNPAELWNAALGGDRRAAARLMSIVEDDRAGAGVILDLAHRSGNDAHIVGITGAPGAGKSTLGNALISRLRATHGSVGVVAVDPSSPFTGGAILGDRVRMQDHVSDLGVFVRSMSSRGRLGGLADGTAKVTTILDALGYDPVLIETVGVGQSEVEVMELADTVVVVVTPGMGDGIQAAKAGLLEVADILVVNKADLPGAQEVVRELRQMLELGTHRDWEPPIVTTVASVGEGVDDVVEAIAAHRNHLDETGGIENVRRRRAEITIKRARLAALAARMDNEGIDTELIERVTSRRIDPWAAAAETD
jgi:LAO/AO transport system kinase